MTAINFSASILSDSEMSPIKLLPSLQLVWHFIYNKVDDSSLMRRVQLVKVERERESVVSLAGRHL